MPCASSRRVNQLRSPERRWSWSRITSAPRLHRPDVVHVLLDGRIVRSAQDLASSSEKKGYEWLEPSPASMTTTAAQAPTFPAELVRWREEFESFRAGLPRERAGVAPRPAPTGMGAFEELGFPTTRQEDWRHTSVAPIARTSFRRAPTTASVADLAVLGAWTSAARSRAAARIVNGRYAPGSLFGGTSADGVQDTQPARNARPRAPARPALSRPARPAAPAGPSRPLNAAFSMTAHSSPCPKGRAPEPIHLVFLSARAPGPRPAIRACVWAGGRARSTIIESYADFRRRVSHQRRHRGHARGRRRRDHYRLQRESARAFHVARLRDQGRGTRFASHAISWGPLSRLDIRQVFAGRGRRVRAQRPLPRRRPPTPGHPHLGGPRPAALLDARA